MKLREQYLGMDDPFVGDHKLWLHSLPTGARITAANITLTPTKAWTNQAELFREAFVFPPLTVGQGELAAADWGVTKTISTALGAVEVDFHARRTLAGVVGGGGKANLQVDMGGVYVDIASDGSIMAPNKSRLTVELAGVEKPLPGLTVNKFELTQAPDNTNFVDVTKVIIRSAPTNLTVRLGELPPFWSLLGEMATTQTSPDFAALFNAFLTTATVTNGFYSIPFIIHSDAITRLNAELTVEYMVEQRVLPEYLPAVTLPYGYSSLPGVDDSLLTLKLPARATVTKAGGAAQGAFDASRVVAGQLGVLGATDLVTVAPDRTLAQPIQLDHETPVSRIDLPLANTQAGLAGLHLAIQEDADGKPSGKVLTSAAVIVEKPPPGSSAWGSAPLPAEFRFAARTRYWLVVQSVAGKAFWDVQPATPGALGMQASTDGGFSWRIASTDKGAKPLSALYRLRYTPERFSVPLELQIGNEPAAKRVRFDHFAPLGRVEFNLDFAQALDDYLKSPALIPPCDAGELLVNGSFDLPPHDDATRRLFGFDEGSGDLCVQTVDLSRGIDLSRERFIALSVDHEIRRIDCAGVNPARTTMAEIAAAINRTFGSDVATLIPDDPGSEQRVEICPIGCSAGPVKLHRWQQTGLPTGWQQVLTSGGAVGRTKMIPVVPNSPSLLLPERVVGVLYGGKDPATLLQRLLVAADCTYRLRFAFKIVVFEILGLTSLSTATGTRPPRWEVHWLDAQGRLIQQEAQELFEREDQPHDAYGMSQADIRLRAPAGAAQAELRFVQSAALPLLLDDVSYQPTVETLVNEAFVQWQRDEATAVEEPVSWSHTGGWIRQVEVGKASCLHLAGNGPEDAVVAQKGQVVAGERYELRAYARPVPFPTADPTDLPVTERQRLELRWLAGAAVIGNPFSLPLDEWGFLAHAWAGVAPEQATQVEIRLVQPKGKGNLVVGLVSFRRTNLATVPLTFLSEAPGELTLSDLRITYNPPAPAQLLVSLAEVATRSQAQLAVPVVAVTPPLPEATPTAPLSARSVDLVSGVGSRYAATLRGLTPPITTIAELAALDPTLEIADIPQSRRLEIKTAAEMILNLALPVAPFAVLADTTLEALVNFAPEALAARTGHDQQGVAQFQRALRSLRLLIHLEAFRTLRLADLVT